MQLLVSYSNISKLEFTASDKRTTIMVDVLEELSQSDIKNIIYTASKKRKV